MSVTVVKDNAVTVITVAADKKSMLPLLCQILKTLCYSPMCCSVHKGLMQTNVTAALGTIQIMVGLFNIALGPGRSYLYPAYLPGVGAAYWLGSMFIIAGIMTLLAGRFPSLFMVIFAVFLNIFGSILAITGAVLYAINVAAAPATRLCDLYDALSRDSCKYVAFYFQRLLAILDLTMVVLAVLQLCVCISFAVLGIKALVNRKKQEGDVEHQLKEVLLTSPGS